jgi:hypothetical protein
VYCEQLNFPSCLTPVEFSEQRQKKVEGWIAAIPPDLAKREEPAIRSYRPCTFHSKIPTVLPKSGDSSLMA